MTIKLQPGDMDQIVTLLKPTPLPDAFGQNTSYIIVAKVSAKITPLRRSQFFAAQQMQSPASLMVEVYWRIDVRADWRVEWMGRTLDITADPIDVDARHDVLELMCREVPL